MLLKEDKYFAQLVNKNGCIFATKYSSNLKKIKAWASGCGHDYRLEIYKYADANIPCPETMIFLQRY